MLRNFPARSLLLLALAVSACQPTGSPPAPLPPTPLSTMLQLPATTAPCATLPSQPWVCVRPTSPHPSPTPAPTPSATAPSAMATVSLQLLSAECSPIAPGLPTDAFGSLAAWTDQGLLLLDMQSAEAIAKLLGPDDFTAENGFFPSVSPGNRYLAYVQGSAIANYTPHSLHVVDSSGRSITTPVWRPEWDLVTGWLDESRLLIAVDADPPGTMAVYNPFSQSITVVPPSFGDILTTLPPDPDWYWYTEIALYDPSLTRVAYVRYPDRAYRLWDALGLNPLWTSTFLEWAYDPPAWSPDFSRVAFVVHPYAKDSLSGQLTIIGRDGEMLDSLDFATAETAEGVKLTASHLSWAPSGDRLAFWLVTFGLQVGDPIRTLAVLDIAGRTVTEYCIPGGGSMPVWSPDGRFVSAHEWIVDTSSGVTYQVPRDVYYTLGWLANPR